MSRKCIALDSIAILMGLALAQLPIGRAAWLDDHQCAGTAPCATCTLGVDSMGNPCDCDPFATTTYKVCVATPNVSCNATRSSAACPGTAYPVNSGCQGASTGTCTTFRRSCQ